jgi:hypothetical protein
MVRALDSVLVLLCLLSLLPWAAGDDKPDPAFAVLEKGVKALGGEDRLLKYKAILTERKGTLYRGKDKDEFTGKWAIQPPDRFRSDIELIHNGATFREVRVLIGDKGWIKQDNQSTQELDKEFVEKEKKQIMTPWLHLVTLLRDKSYRFELLPGDSKVGDKPVAGIKVSRGDTEFNLYFAKDSGLLLKATRKVKDESGKDIEEEQLFDDYQEAEEVKGIYYATKRTARIGGKKVVEEVITKYQPLESLREKDFEKPK